MKKSNIVFIFLFLSKLNTTAFTSFASKMTSIEGLPPRAQRVAQLIEDVYGRCTSVSTWQPRPFKASPAPSRYLWSDAFGVCNLLSLHYASKEEGAAGTPTSSIWIDMADVLINDVHNTLGKNRSLTKRLGNATDEHPLLGGLRIGKVIFSFRETNKCPIYNL